MKYNDNFVLPPEEVLKKMRVAYEQKTIKTSTQQINNKNKQKILALSQKIIMQMKAYTNYLENVLNSSEAFLLKQKCSTALSLTNKNLQLLQQAYPSVNVENFKKTTVSTFNNKIKQMLFYQNNILQNLVELVFVEDDNKALLNQMVKEKLKLTHSLIAQL